MGTGDYFGVIFKNNGGVFTESTYLPATYWGECIATDFNGDGFPDLLLNGYDVNENPFAALYKNDGVTFVEELQLGFSIYPNPASKYVTISNNTAKITQVTETDLSGKIMCSKQVLTDIIHLDISTFPKGVYVLRLQSEFGIAFKKLLVQ